MLLGREVTGSIFLRLATAIHLVGSRPECPPNRPGVEPASRRTTGLTRCLPTVERMLLRAPEGGACREGQTIPRGGYRPGV